MAIKIGDSGKDELANGVKFVWMLGGESVPEIYAWLEYADRRIVPGSSGWWRTEDPVKARRLAEQLYAEEIGGAEA